LDLNAAGLERLCEQMGLPRSYVPGLKESVRTPLLAMSFMAALR
jgi:hypothetical protein